MTSIIGKATYNAAGHVLGTCARCGAAHYVEPHGTTAPCACSPDWTAHNPIPWDCRDPSGTRVTRDSCRGPARATTRPARGLTTSRRARRCGPDRAP